MTPAASDRWKARASQAAASLTLAALYLAASRLGMLLRLEGADVSPFWPPSGLALGALVVFGRRLWPGVLLGALAVSLEVLPTLGVASRSVLPVSLATAAGSTMAAVLGAALVERFCGGTRALDRPATAVRFALLGPGAATLLAAAVGSAALAAAGAVPWSRFAPLLGTWYLGDAVGALVAAPLVVAWADLPDRPILRWRAVEFGCWLALLLVVTDLAWNRVPLTSLARYPLEQAAVPLLLWAAFRFGQRGSTLAVALVSALAVRETAHGHGPFVGSSLSETVLLLNTFVAGVAAALLALSSALVESAQHHHSLEEAKEALEARVKERTAELEAANRLLKQDVASVLSLARRLGTPSPAEEELRLRDLELLTLLRSSRAALDDLPLQQVLEVVIEEVSATAGFPIVAVGLLDESRKQLEFEATRGLEDLEERGVRSALLDHSLSRLTQTTQALDKAEALPPQGPADPDLRALGIRTFVCVPLLSGTEALGVLSLAHPDEVRVPERLSNLITVMANQLASLVRRKRVEGERARLSQAIYHAADAIVLTDARGGILYANPAFERATGYTLAEVRGSNPRILKSGKHPPEFYEQMWSVLTSGRVWRGCIINRRKDGSLFEEMTTIAPVLGAAGQTLGYVAVKRDLGQGPFLPFPPT